MCQYQQSVVAYITKPELLLVIFLLQRASNFHTYVKGQFIQEKFYAGLNVYMDTFTIILVGSVFCAFINLNLINQINLLQQTTKCKKIDTIIL